LGNTQALPDFLKQNKMYCKRGEQKKKKIQYQTFSFYFDDSGSGKMKRCSSMKYR